MLNKYKIIGLSLLLACTTAQSKSTVADLLSWIDDPNPCNLCRGHFAYSEEGQIVARQATVSLKDNWSAQLCDAAYQIPGGWGTAGLLKHDNSGNITLKHATFSTCSPKNASWKIVAPELNIDRQKGIGVAKGAQFRVYNVPLLYVPWMSFPIDKRRKSGFLIPEISYSHDDGLELEIPYYFNLALNYDAKLSARIMTERGVQLNGLGRYLTQHSHGKFYVSYLPYDQAWREFQRSSLEKYDGDPLRQPFLSRIENADSYRAMTHANHVSDWQPHWRADIELNWVSDDYFLHDFGNNPILSNTDQLMSMAQLQYQDLYWRIFGRVEGYQTLHPIDSASSEPYNRLPQIGVDLFYPPSPGAHDLHSLGDAGSHRPLPQGERWANWALTASMDFSRFDRRRNFITNDSEVTGERLHVRPGLILPLRANYGYMDAKAEVDVTGYKLHDQDEGNDSNPSRILPILSVDSGLFFERCTHLFGNTYVQTLEPRAYYLFVPNTNQDDIPLFDTTHPPVNFEQQFYHNRFAGLDRLGDANQLTLALSTRFLDEYHHQQQLSAHLGTTLYFMDRHVCLTPDCDDDKTRDYPFAPLMAGIDVKLSSSWTFRGHIAWDMRNYRTDTATAKLHFQPFEDGIINLGYEFVREGDIVLDSSNTNLSRLDLSITWPITPRISVLGDWNYNLSHSHPQTYFAGLSYESCCWAIRAIASRTTLDTDLNNNAKFDTKYYLQLKFKGLGTIANRNPHALLTDGIEDFYDHF